jgi:hypothetical protein
MIGGTNGEYYRISSMTSELYRFVIGFVVDTVLD